MQKKESEDIPEAGSSKDVFGEDFHTTPKRAISTPQSVRLSCSTKINAKCAKQLYFLKIKIKISDIFDFYLWRENHDLRQNCVNVVKEWVDINITSQSWIKFSQFCAKSSISF